MPKTSWGTPPSFSALLPVVKLREVSSLEALDARLPELSATIASVQSCPVHHVGRALVWTEEEDLFVFEEIDDRILDARRLTLEQEVEHRVDVLLEHDTRLGSDAAGVSM